MNSTVGYDGMALGLGILRSILLSYENFAMITMSYGDIFSLPKWIEVRSIIFIEELETRMKDKRYYPTMEDRTSSLLLRWYPIRIKVIVIINHPTIKRISILNFILVSSLSILSRLSFMFRIVSFIRWCVSWGFIEITPLNDIPQALRIQVIT